MKYALIEFKVQKKLFRSSKRIESLKLFGSEQASRCSKTSARPHVARATRA